MKKPNSKYFVRLSHKGGRSRNLKIVREIKRNTKQLKIKKEFAKLSLNGTLFELRQSRKSLRKSWRTNCRFIIRIGGKLFFTFLPILFSFMIINII